MGGLFTGGKAAPQGPTKAEQEQAAQLKAEAEQKKKDAETLRISLLRARESGAAFGGSGGGSNSTLG